MQSRREFLVLLPLVVPLGAAIRTLGIGFVDAATFSEDERELIKPAIDEIIPEDDGRPSATAAGALEYLQQLGWQYPDDARELQNFMSVLRQASQSSFGQNFHALPSKSRIEILTAIEKRVAPKLFTTFLSYVYEAYYTEERVMGLMACMPPPPSEADETLLVDVQRMPPRYREMR